MLLLCANNGMLFLDPDTAWHLAAGNAIHAAGHIPMTDPFAFTSAGVPWINLAWFWDMIISALYTGYAWQGPVAFHSTSSSRSRYPATYSASATWERVPMA